MIWDKRIFVAHWHVLYYNQRKVSRQNRSDVSPGAKRGEVHEMAYLGMLSGRAPFAALIAVLGLQFPVLAKMVPISPASKHQNLTMSTDESRGYLVQPGKPMKVNVVGPGDLTILVRLNQKGKQELVVGQLEIRRANKVVKKVDLSLHRSRVGAYKEDGTYVPSLPKVFKVAVPAGHQAYQLFLKAGRNITMTVVLSYETEADQALAQAGGDGLEVVPLVGPADAGGDKPGVNGSMDDLPLVPLVAMGTDDEKGAGKPASKPGEPGKSQEDAGKNVTVKTTPVPLKGTPGSKTPEKKPDEKHSAQVSPTEKIAGSSLPTNAATGRAGGDPSAAAGVSQVKMVAPAAAKRVPFISLGAKLGQISPIDRVGGTSFTGSLDVRYVVPALEGRISIGVEAGYYHFQMLYTNQDLKVTTDIIPVSLQLFYRLPLGLFFEPYVGAGVDLFIAKIRNARADSPGSEIRGSGIGFGGHGLVGLESKIGPGFVLLEFRVGHNKSHLEGVVSNINLTGISSVVGYRFVL